MVLAADWGVGQVLYSFIWFVLFFIWIWLAITVFADIFRSHDLSGVTKALWVITVIVFPYVGVLVYLIVRGHRMNERALEAARARDAAMRAYIRDAAQSSRTDQTDDLARLTTLREHGVIDDAELERLRSKIMATAR